MNLLNKKFITQEERINSLSPEIFIENPELKEQLIKENKQENNSLLKDTFSQLSYEEGNIYFHRKINKALSINWRWYKRYLDEKKRKEASELIFKPKQFRFKNDKLRISEKEFPNLKTLYACGLGLKKVRIKHSKLENLYLTDNKLSQINLNNVPNLRNILINKNQLEKLSVKHLKYLEDLRVNKNALTFLDVRNLERLKYLDVAGNVVLNHDIIDNLINRRITYSEFNKLKLGNNPNLEFLDLGETDLGVGRHFPCLPSLESLSLRYHKQYSEKRKNKLIPCFPKLKFLDYYRSCIEGIIFHKKHPLKTKNLRIHNQKSYTNTKGFFNSDVAIEWEELFNNFLLEDKVKSLGMDNKIKLDLLLVETLEEGLSRLKAKQNNQMINSELVYYKLAISLITFVFLVLVLLFSLINKMIKKFLMNLIVSINSSKK